MKEPKTNKRDKLVGVLKGNDQSKEITPVDEVSPAGGKIFPMFTLNQDYLSKEDFKVGDKGSMNIEYEVSDIHDNEKDKNITFKITGVAKGK